MKKIFLSFLIFLTINAGAENIYRGFMPGGGATLSDFQELEKWNVNFIRYGIQYDNADNVDLDGYLNWLDQELVKLDEILALCGSLKIKVLLDLHNPPGGYYDRYARLPQFKMFQEQWAQDGLSLVWNKIANRYKDNPYVWGYQIVNEPAEGRMVATGLLKWNALARKLTKEIKLIDTKKYIVVSAAYGNQQNLRKLRFIRGSKMVYAVNFFSPMTFTHQGLPEFPIAISYPSKEYNKKKILRNIRPIVNFKTKHNTKMLIHEFGVPRWAPDNSAYRYLKDLLPIFEKSKFNWVYLPFRGTADIFSLEHSTDMNDTTNYGQETDRSKLILEFFKKNKPNNDI